MIFITSIDKSNDKEILDNSIPFFIQVISFSSCEHFILSLIKASNFFSGCVLDSEE